ncbi:hypothetical protein FF011L_32950 [Roseimaritima multifibrata]|uniref:DUF547 domain-containing protein n=1 Tax=Roseimaritima multifibrata TaxID=1930274 RepID=A0A517MI06_9BACT|nr:DUF547 domain-containing protein [Roseimaritima multifibrata]QDS94516.1 hypothetical protein FF011L_32950 [Roseimaritima multifibrata]
MMKDSLASSFAIALTAATLSLFSNATCFAGTDVVVGVSVPVSQQVSIDQIDPGQWDVLLKRYVDQNGNVNYAKWKQTPADVRALEQFLSYLSTANPKARASQTEKVAFWINAYNALTVHGILREYPTSSIRNHTAKLFGYNIWDDLLLTVGGTPYSLNQMEHEILRKMGEPRIHFAIVCASRSCPRLLSEAYTSAELDGQLTANAKVFFANSGNFQYDVNGRKFRLSAIMDWFGEDFGRDQAAQLRTIAPYLPSRAAYDAAIGNSVSVSYLDYDWGLNDQATAPPARR